MSGSIETLLGPLQLALQLARDGARSLFEVSMFASGVDKGLGSGVILR